MDIPKGTRTWNRLIWTLLQPETVTFDIILQLHNRATV